MLMAARYQISETVVADSSPPSINDTLKELRLALQASPYLPLRRLQCEEHGREIVLRGNVPTYYLKQLAHCLARKIAGHTFIDDQVEVIPPGTRYSIKGAMFGALLPPTQPR